MEMAFGVELRIRPEHVAYEMSISMSELIDFMKDRNFPPSDGNDGRPYWRFSTIAPAMLANKKES
ncbi:hypothetical protein ACFQ3P_13710 [Paraburkholderia sabiae]|uniref:Uncharacterized protein n=1 Tax=Paraburkholderia sabiae TaxID=273251 RepID=A0ABU9QD35_9BURK|nr:hypothetical protein [Paraburkholderia sabiae]WJZ76155.1 hypothetical protein QEN71_10250 [Paraburkholderia sabiae]